MTLKDTSGGGSIAIETLLVFLLRASFFFLASRYLQRTLFSDLRQVIHEETSTSASPGGLPSPSAASGYDTPHSAASYGFAHSPPVSPGAGGNGPSLREQLYSLSAAGRAGANGSSSILPTTAYTGRSPSGTTQRNRANSRGGGSSGGGATSSSHAVMTNAKAGGSKGYTSTLAGTIFCLSVSECSSLFALILFGGALSLESRLLNWNLSLGAVLALIVLVIPFGMCLLLSMRQRATSNSLRRTLFFTSIPFAVYLVVLYQLGDYLSSALGVETGSRTFGLFSTTLDRICVPGIGLIAALSGGGAVNTAWEAYEWRERFKSESVVTEGHINAAQRSLGQTRTDLAARQAELDAVQSSSHDDSRGFVSRMFSTSPHAAKITSLQAEISGLQAMDMQMSRDLQLLRKRKEINELGKTFWGKLMQGLGWGFSAYCVYRVAVSCVNLLFGHTFSSPDGSSGGQARSQPADLASALLVRLATALGWSIDVHTWSKAIGLVLTGSIILVNINAVLGYVSRTFRATSAGVSASFMLLFLSQLMAVYLLTSLISLPHPETSDSGASANSAATLLDTLPDFRVFSRLFDGVFLLAAVGCFVLRWLQRKIRVDEHLGLQDFV